MKLTRFRVQQYKRIEDSGWIEVGDVTAMVGKNEVGKSSIFRALSKLNPSDQEGFNKQQELPHKSYVQLKDETVFPITAEFKISENEEFITEIKKHRVLIAKKDYNNNFHFNLDDQDVSDEDTASKIEKLLPRFIYFDNYDKIKGRLDIPSFISSYESDPNNRKIRTEKCMFEYVGLDPKKLLELRTTPEMDELEKYEQVEGRKILCDSAASRMTDEFRNWWKVRDYRFDYRMDNDSFGVYVSDHIDTTSVELDQRSSGLRYFFSFFLIFTVESQREHTNSILLLDEPGLHYHATFQLDLIGFFKELSKKNQLLYSTHSPFLVDDDNLDDVKIVYEDKESKKIMVSDNGVWPKDAETLFPLRLSWWNSVFQSYMKAKTHMLVEGITDSQILKKINQILNNNNNPGLDSEIVIVPGGGNKMSALISILKSSNISQFYFLDGDESGLNRAKRYSEDFALTGLTNKEFSNLEHSSLEDLIPMTTYLNAVRSAYGLSEIKLDENAKNQMITHQIKTFLEKNGYGNIDKLKITKELLPLLDDVQKEVCDTFVPIFSKINEIKRTLDD